MKTGTTEIASGEIVIVTGPSGGGKTTHRYVQDDVHDFAWTTSPDFIEKTQRFEHAALPPVENLRRFVAQGADVVVYSGGKAIRGPQASGIRAGRRHIVESVALQQQDMLEAALGAGVIGYCLGLYRGRKLGRDTHAPSR